MTQKKPTAKQLKQVTRDKKATLRKMHKKAKRISEKGTSELTIIATVQCANSTKRAPKLKMSAFTFHPKSSVWQQSTRSFESLEDLLNPDNRFISVDKLIYVLEEDFAEVALLNQTAKTLSTVERTLQKALNK